MRSWAAYLKKERPHSAINYLCPADCRRDPTDCLSARERKLAEAVEQRALYWEAHADVKKQS